MNFTNTEEYIQYLQALQRAPIIEHEVKKTDDLGEEIKVIEKTYGKPYTYWPHLRDYIIKGNPDFPQLFEPKAIAESSFGNIWGDFCGKPKVYRTEFKDLSVRAVHTDKLGNLDQPLRKRASDVFAILKAIEDDFTKCQTSIHPQACPVFWKNCSGVASVLNQFWKAQNLAEKMRDVKKVDNVPQVDIPVAPGEVAPSVETPPPVVTPSETPLAPTFPPSFAPTPIPGPPPPLTPSFPVGPSSEAMQVEPPIPSPAPSTPTTPLSVSPTTPTTPLPVPPTTPTTPLSVPPTPTAPQPSPTFLETPSEPFKKMRFELFSTKSPLTPKARARFFPEGTLSGEEPELKRKTRKAKSPEFKTPSPPGATKIERQGEEKKLAPKQAITAITPYNLSYEPERVHRVNRNAGLWSPTQIAAGVDQTCDLFTIRTVERVPTRSRRGEMSANPYQDRLNQVNSDPTMAFLRGLSDYRRFNADIRRGTYNPAMMFFPYLIRTLRRNGYPLVLMPEWEIPEWGTLSQTYFVYATSLCKYPDLYRLFFTHQPREPVLDSRLTQKSSLYTQRLFELARTTRLEQSAAEKEVYGDCNNLTAMLFPFRRGGYPDWFTFSQDFSRDPSILWKNEAIFAPLLLDRLFALDESSKNLRSLTCTIVLLWRQKNPQASWSYVQPLLLPIPFIAANFPDYAELLQTLEFDARYIHAYLREIQMWQLTLEDRNAVQQMMQLYQPKAGTQQLSSPPVDILKRIETLRLPDKEFSSLISRAALMLRDFRDVLQVQFFDQPADSKAYEETWSFLHSPKKAYLYPNYPVSATGVEEWMIMDMKRLNTQQLMLKSLKQPSAWLPFGKTLQQILKQELYFTTQRFKFVEEFRKWGNFKCTVLPQKSVFDPQELASPLFSTFWQIQEAAALIYGRCT